MAGFDGLCDLMGVFRGSYRIGVGLGHMSDGLFSEPERGREEGAFALYLLLQG